MKFSTSDEKNQKTFEILPNNILDNIRHVTEGNL